MKDFFKKTLPQLFTKLVVSVGLKLSGPLAWVASLVISKYAKKIGIELYYLVRAGKDKVVSWFKTKKYEKN